MAVTIVPISPTFAGRVFKAAWVNTYVRLVAERVLGVPAFERGVDRRKRAYVRRLPSPPEFMKLRSKPEFRAHFRQNKQAEAELIAWIHSYESNITFLAFLSEELCAQHEFAMSACGSSSEKEGNECCRGSTVTSETLFTHFLRECSQKESINLKPIQQKVDSLRSSMVHKISEGRYSEVYPAGTYLISPVLTAVEQELLEFLCEKCKIPTARVTRPSWLIEDEDCISIASKKTSSAVEKTGMQEEEPPLRSRGVGQFLMLLFTAYMLTLIFDDVQKIVEKARNPQRKPNGEAGDTLEKNGAVAEADVEPQLMEAAAEKFDLRDHSTPAVGGSSSSGRLSQRGK